MDHEPWRELPLSQGKVALVSVRDFDRVSAFKWSYTRNPGGNGHRGRKRAKEYAVRRISWMENGKRKQTGIYLHRFIMGPTDDLLVDHRDGNGLDNRRENLRLATHSENRLNQKPTGEEPWL